MKGIVLAGGTGSRLHPLTKVTNKHLLPIGEKPMVYYPIESLVASGITDIMIITGTDQVGNMLSLLGSGDNFGCQFTYRVQDRPDGVAGALSLCEHFVGDDSCVVILGDNVFSHNLKEDILEFEENLSNLKCRLFLKTVPDPSRYGIAKIEGKEITMLVEKPKEYISDLCVCGIYMYDSNVFSAIRSLELSDRKEYEITDVNDFYLKNGVVTYGMLPGMWTDAGTHASYQRANMLVAQE